MTKRIVDELTDDVESVDQGGSQHSYTVERDKGKEDQCKKKEIKSQILYRKYMNAMVVLFLSINSTLSKISKNLQTARQTVIEKFSGPKNFHDIPLRNEVGTNQAAVDIQSALISPKISPNRASVSEEQSVMDKKVNAQKLSPGTKMPWSSRAGNRFSAAKVR